MVLTAGLGIERFLDTFIGSFRSNVDICGANLSSLSAVLVSSDSVPFN